MHKNRLFVLMLTAYMTFFACFGSVYAAKSVDDLKAEMQKRNEQIKQKEKEINAKKSEKDAELKKRNSLDIQISGLLDDIESTQTLIDAKEAQIQEKNAEIEVIAAEIDENDRKLKERLVIMYEYGSTSYLDLLLEADGLSDLVTRISVIKSVYNYDKSVINRFIELKKQTEDAKQLIVNEQNEQIQARTILEEKKSKLDSLKKEKDKIINALNSDIKALEKEEAKIEADYQAIQNELNAALSSSSKSTTKYTGNGKFCWPSAVSQRITSPYGYRPHPISGGRKLHRGIDIGAALGTNVLAAEAGTVVTAGWNNSYGYYITINHGSGLVTLYAHNSKLLVSKGDKVSKGQVIAKCGSTGNSTGPHIHFEVQVNGQLQNPMNYF